MDQDAHVIRKRAERARAAIAADVDALGEKLNVKKQAVQKKDDLVDQFKEKVGMSHDGEETRLGHEAHTVMDVVREHPMATLMAGVGGVGIQRIISAWREQHTGYPHNRSRGSNGNGNGAGYVAVETYPTLGATVVTAEEYDVRGETSDDEGGKLDGAKAKAHDVADSARERVSDVSGSAKERVSGVTGSAKERVSGVGTRVTGMGSGAKDKASNVAMTAKEHVPSDRRELETSMRSHMGLWGLGAFALGAALGSFLPSTRMEREKVGHARDEAMDMAKEKADDAKQALEAGLEAVKDHAEEAMSDMKEHAREAVSDAKDTAKDELKGSTEEDSSASGSSTGGATSTGAPAVKRPGPILGSRDMETSTPDSPIPGGPIRPL